MKVSIVTLAALLLVAIFSLTEAHLGTGPAACCLQYVPFPIRRNLITSVYKTSKSCSLPGIILVTKKGMQLCADPQASWVQAHMKHFQME
ncbi:C-C motif chemokine 4-like [Colius striatus]|uniref:C-C motif chemokine 4-like n=1 Tax=Colius striatus TaxID=57412 RepID=UPI002B1CFB74|nr:C-C motif chemokine 4-like [Colius striatus]